MLSGRAALAACVFAVLALPWAAAGANPAAGLAKQLEASMQAYYAKTQPGLKITGGTCKIAANQASARCHVRFSVVKARAVGVFVVAIVESRAGVVKTKTLSVTCSDSKTGAKLKNC